MTAANLPPKTAGLLLRAVASLLLTGCAGKFDLSPVRLPTRVAADQADAVYQQHRIRCDNGTCKRADGKHSLKRIAKHAYPQAKKVYDSRRRTRNLVRWTTVGAGTATMLVGLMLSGMADQQETSADNVKRWTDTTRMREKARHYDAASLPLIITGSTIAATGLLVSMLIGTPDKKFEESYNRALRRDIQQRIDRRPQAAPPRPLAARRHVRVP